MCVTSEYAIILPEMVIVITEVVRIYDTKKTAAIITCLYFSQHIPTPKTGLIAFSLHEFLLSETHVPGNFLILI